MADKIDSTLIAAFRSAADAQAASADLQRAGIPCENIYFESNASGIVESNASGKESSPSKTAPGEGGITGWFKSMFEEDDPDTIDYERAISQGNTLLRVDVDQDEVSGIEEILNRHSPVEVHSQEETKTGTAHTKAVPVVREDIQVGKRQVLRGGVRVYSRIVEEPVEESIRLREERARVERRPVNRPATEADFSAAQERVIELREFSEEPVIAKQSRVVEEVLVGKDVSERTETVRDTVRRTEVSVEQAPGTSASAFDDSDFRSDFQNRYSAMGGSYETYLPAYRYGSEMASDPQYQGHSFDEIESDLRTNYGQRYPDSGWDKVKGAIRYGWNKVTGKVRATTS